MVSQFHNQVWSEEQKERWRQKRDRDAKATQKERQAAAAKARRGCQETDGRETPLEMASPVHPSPAGDTNEHCVFESNQADARVATGAATGYESALDGSGETSAAADVGSADVGSASSAAWVAHSPGDVMISESAVREAASLPIGSFRRFCNVCHQQFMQVLAPTLTATGTSYPSATQSVSDETPLPRNHIVNHVWTSETHHYIPTHPYPPLSLSRHRPSGPQILSSAVPAMRRLQLCQAAAVDRHARSRLRRHRRSRAHRIRNRT